MSEAGAIDTLDDVISGNEPAAVEPIEPTAEAPSAEPEVVSEPESAPAEQAAEAPSTEPEAKVEEPKQDSPAESDVDTEWTKAMALDERRKRQELQKKLDELEARQVEQPKRPDVFEDQDAAFQHQDLATDAKINNLRIELSQEMMRDAHPDYDQLEAEFITLAQDNPILLQEMAQAKSPARYAYNKAKQAREAAELNDIDAYKAKIKAQVMAEIEAEAEAKAEAKAEAEQAKSDAIPPSLTDTSGKSGFDTDVNDSLDDILN